MTILVQSRVYRLLEDESFAELLHNLSVEFAHDVLALVTRRRSINKSYFVLVGFRKSL